MGRLGATAIALAAILASVTGAGAVPAEAPFLLGPPPQDGPVIVRAHFDLLDVNEVNDTSETFEITGVLTLRWRDPRQAFDPAVAGVDEKIFQGDYQFNELATGWYPQVVLANVSGTYQKTGVLLRVQPDGSQTLIEPLNASVETTFDMRRFPFDGQRLHAVFEVLGFDRDEVRLELEPPGVSPLDGAVSVSQWTIIGTSAAIEERVTSYAGPRGVGSAFVVHVDVERQSWFARRLIVAPLVVIVMLSFSVFWMDRSSLGDRVSVSFIGILTVVAYQLVTAEHLPRIAYVTLMHGFLNISFLTMCATVVVNLVVGALDQQGRGELGDRVDRICRWAFPLGYFALQGLLAVIELLIL